MSRNNYSNNVFINCPFDDKYKSLMDAIFFVIFACGFYPRCALEENDSGTVRLNKLKKIIEESKFGIHDLSRTGLDKATKLPRFNMPLELGIFLGAREFGDKKQKKKLCLILDRKKYRYQVYISDISANDVQAHGGDNKELFKCIRNWLSDSSKRKNIPGASEILRRFKLFKKELPAMCKLAPIKVKELTYNDYMRLISRWLKAR